MDENHDPTSLQHEALRLHRQWRGKLSIDSKVSVADDHALAIAYTPGVAEPCREIARDAELIDTYTGRWNMVAVVTDGSAVLGLGNIGARASLPVMEGKSVLFKAFGGVDAFPLCVESRDVDDIVRTVRLLEPSFGGINLEDIAAPSCFEIERRLIEECDIPVFHDDQHGTAVVVMAAAINACRVTERAIADLKVVINGAGAAGLAIARMLRDEGVEDLILCDSGGVIGEHRRDLSQVKQEVAGWTNRGAREGGLAAAMEGANLFIGVSVKGAVSPQMVSSMEQRPIVLAMANPDPEILPDQARAAGAAVVATGRSDFPNQVNNVLGFPGIFRGALDVRAANINENMKAAAARALAGLVGDELSAENIIPRAFDLRVAPAVAGAVAAAAVESGVAREPRTAAEVAASTREMLGGSGGKAGKTREAP
ncbi:MAG TPA: NADP-dependent malic enzyme [Actinobacteria bacterium]|nr:NADP-dependent malic enzyme [Actinomycetota bacterium]